MEDDDLVEVTLMVPSRGLGKIYLAAAAAWEEEEGEEEEEDNGSESGSTRAQKGFGAATVRKNYLGGSSAHWRPFLNELADHPDEPVAWEDLCKAIGLTGKAASGMLGAAERRCKKHPPYEKWYEDGTYWFQMPATAAQIIREIIKELGEK